MFYGRGPMLPVEKVGDTLLINPGEVMGRFGKSTFAWYDTETNHVEIVQVT